MQAMKYLPADKLFANLVVIRSQSPLPFLLAMSGNKRTRYGRGTNNVRTRSPADQKETGKKPCQKGDSPGCQKLTEVVCTL